MEFEEFVSKLKLCKFCKKNGIEPKPLIWGKPEAKIVHISQAPSKNAGNSGRAFSKDENTSDASGKKLIEWYQIDKKIFYNPKIFYITAIAHCYPGKGKGGDKGPPLICAEKWLMKELSYLNPKLYIIVGGFAARFFFPHRKFNELVFKDQTFRNIPTLVIPHPSPANKKWFKDNPKFEKRRLPEIRKHIRKVVNLKIPYIES